MQGATHTRHAFARTHNNARNFGVRRNPEFSPADAELGAKIFCAITLIGLPLGFTLGCIVVLLWFR